MMGWFPLPRGERGTIVVNDLVNIRFHALLVAVKDAPVQALFGGHIHSQVGGRICRRGRRNVLKMLDESLECLRVLVEDQVFGEFFLRGRDVGIGSHLGRVDDGHIQPGLHAVIKHDRIKDRTGLRCKPKRQVRDAQRGEYAGQVLLDQADTGDGLHGGFRKLGVAGAEGEGQGVENQRLGTQAMLVDSDVVDPPGHFQLAVSFPGHALFVNRQDDDSGIMGFCQRKDPVRLEPTRFEMRRVDQAAPGGGFEGGFKHVQLGGIDHQRHFNAHLQFFDRLAHQFHFVGALGDGTGDVEGVRAKIDLLAGDFQDRVIVFLKQQALELLAALGIAALPDQQGRRVLAHGDGRDRGRQARGAQGRAGGMRA